MEAPRNTTTATLARSFLERLNAAAAAAPPSGPDARIHAELESLERALSLRRQAIADGEDYELLTRDAVALCKRVVTAPAPRTAVETPATWRKIPDEYQTATMAGMKLWTRPALKWNRATHPFLAIWGPVGQGKSSAAAVAAKAQGLTLEWSDGYSMRDAYNRHSRGEGKDWSPLLSARLVVLDDIDKGTFTPAWLAALYGLIEHRFSRRLPTIWTANYGENELAQKFSAGGDPETAEAIERRLFQNSLIITPI